MASVIRPFPQCSSEQTHRLVVHSNTPLDPWLCGQDGGGVEHVDNGLLCATSTDTVLGTAEVRPGLPAGYRLELKHLYSCVKS